MEERKGWCGGMSAEQEREGDYEKETLREIKSICFEEKHCMYK
jgi:hypothetical protein